MVNYYYINLDLKEQSLFFYHKLDLVFLSQCDTHTHTPYMVNYYYINLDLKDVA